MTIGGLCRKVSYTRKKPAFFEEIFAEYLRSKTLSARAKMDVLVYIPEPETQKRPESR